MERQPFTVLQMLPALESGGVERGTLELAGELVRRGHRSLVMSAGGPLVEPLQRDGSRHLQWPVGRKSAATLQYVRRLRRLLQEEHVDILHVRSRVPAWIAEFALRGLPAGNRPRLVTTCHGLYSVNPWSAVMTRGERVIVISNTVRQYVLDNYPGASESDLRLVFRGVSDIEFPRDYRPDPDWLERWQQQYPQLDGRRLVTLPGRMTRYKGHPGFVEVMRRLSTQQPDVVGLIVGGDDPRRKRYAQEIRRTVHRYGLRNIVFTGHRSDIREIYSVSDLVLSMSLNPPEAFGRTTLEALALGTPVAGYDHSGVAEILREMFPQGVVPHGDVDAMTAKVLELLDAPAEVQPNTSFTLQNMLDRTVAVYEELVGQPMSSRSAA